MKRTNKKPIGMGLGIAMGAALGAALGVAAGHLAIWLAVGVAIGGSLRRQQTGCPQCVAAHRQHRDVEQQAKADN